MQAWQIALIAVSVIIIVIGFEVIRQKKTNQRIKNELKKFGSLHNDVLKKNGYLFHVYIINAPKNAEVTINSIINVQVNNGVNNKLYTLKNTKIPRLIIINGNEGRLKRYLNENEMVFITKDDFFWNMYVIRTNQIESFFQKFN